MRSKISWWSGRWCSGVEGLLACQPGRRWGTRRREGRYRSLWQGGTRGPPSRVRVANTVTRTHSRTLTQRCRRTDITFSGSSPCSRLLLYILTSFSPSAALYGRVGFMFLNTSSLSFPSFSFLNVTHRIVSRTRVCVCFGTCACLCVGTCVSVWGVCVYMCVCVCLCVRVSV